MPKFIKLVETDHGSEQPFTRPIWLNVDQITCLIEGIEDAGSFIDYRGNPEDMLAVLETPEQIMALVEGRPDPTQPVDEDGGSLLIRM